jgi:mRNA interferase MazF
MKKDFDLWNSKKKKIDGTERTAFHWKEREVRWCVLGLNIGDEENGKTPDYLRPVVILKKFSKRACLVVSLTTTQKEGKYYFYLGKINNQDSTAILSQIRFIDSMRLSDYMGVISKKQFPLLKEAVIKICF